MPSDDVTMERDSSSSTPEELSHATTIGRYCWFERSVDTLLAPKRVRKGWRAQRLVYGVVGYAV